MGASGNPAKKAAAATKATGRTTAPKRKATPTSAAKVEMLRSRKGIVKRLPIFLDSDVTTEFEEAKAAMDDVNANDLLRARMGEEKLQAVIDRFAAAAEAMDENTVTLVLERPKVIDHDGNELRGRLAYEWLVDQHPPSEEDEAETKRLFGEDATAPYNSDTFPPALISACLVDPVMTPDEVDEIMSTWSQTEHMQVFGVTMEICNGSQIASLGKGSGGMSGS